MKNQKLIIGVTGLSGAGKDSLANCLVEKEGFGVTSLSNRIRNECEKREIKITRDNLIKLGNELRQEFGNDILAKRCFGLIKAYKEECFVVVSIRHPDEVEYFRKQDSIFLLIEVFASLPVRYKRIQKRKGPEDRVTFEEFREQELRERSGSESQQQLDKVNSMADLKILNDTDFADLYHQTFLISQTAKKVLQQIRD